MEVNLERARLRSAMHAGLLLDLRFLPVVASGAIDKPTQQRTHSSRRGVDDRGPLLSELGDRKLGRERVRHRHPDELVDGFLDDQQEGQRRRGDGEQGRLQAREGALGGEDTEVVQERVALELGQLTCPLDKPFEPLVWVSRA
jgi:hypothetical protein